MRRGLLLGFALAAVGCTAIAGIESPIFEPDDDAGVDGSTTRDAATREDGPALPPNRGPFRCADQDADFCDDFESPELRIDDSGTSAGWTTFESVGPVSTLEADGGAFVSFVNGDGGNAIQGAARLVLQREWPFDPVTNQRRRIAFDLTATIEVCPTKARTRLIEFSPASIQSGRNYYVLVDFGTSGLNPGECVARVLAVDSPPDGGTPRGHQQLDSPITLNEKHHLVLEIVEETDGTVASKLVIDDAPEKTYVLSFAATRASVATTSMSAYVGVLGFEDRLRVVIDDVLINYQR